MQSGIGGLLIVVLAALWASQVASAADCTVEAAFAEETFKSITRSRELAERGLPLLEELESISSKATKPNVPLRDQLSQEAIDSFNLVNSQLRHLQHLLFVESSTQRDLEILRKLFRASHTVRSSQIDYIAQHGSLTGFNEHFERNDGKQFERDILSILYLINETFPNEMVQEWEQLEIEKPR